MKLFRHRSLGRPETIETSDFLLLTLPFDFKRVSFQSAGAFFAHILQEVRRRIDTTVRRHPQANWPSPIPLNEGWFQDLANQDELSLREFEDALGYILDRLATPMQHARLVLLLDEMDETVDHSWTETMYGQLRALVYSGELKDQVRLVLAGSRRFLTTNERGSPLWNVLKLHYLYTFTQVETEHLIHRAAGLPRDAAEVVWQQSGGHPFLAQYLLYRLWEEGITNADAKAVERQAARFRFEQMSDLENWAFAIDTPGEQVYRVLASTSDWMDERDIAQAVTSTASEAKQGLIALYYHGLSIHDGTWRRYKRTGDLFKNWFAAQKSSDAPTRPVVFLSYSHKDEAEKNRLVTHLEGLARAGLFDLWVDDHISGGADWEQEIRDAMAKADVAILLISADFLNSDFILGSEVPSLLERRQLHGLAVFPVIAKPCYWESHLWLRRMNVRPKNGKPIWGGESNIDQVDAVLTGIVREVADIIQGQAGQDT